MTYIEMYVISLFYVQVLEIIIAALQTSNVRSKSRGLFVKAEHSLDVTFSLTLRQRSPLRILVLPCFNKCRRREELPFLSDPGALGGTVPRSFSRLQVVVKRVRVPSSLG